MEIQLAKRFDFLFDLGVLFNDLLIKNDQITANVWKPADSATELQTLPADNAFVFPESKEVTRTRRSNPVLIKSG